MWCSVRDIDRAPEALVSLNLLSLVVATSVRYSRRALADLAERDPLTGVGNRRALNAGAGIALQRRIAGTPAAMLLLDIDHFKAVNDTYGHAVGDRILVELTGVITATVRASDDVFRYGGEELLVLANGATTQAAAQLAETLRKRIEEYTFDQSLGITVSISVAEAEPEDTLTSWFASVDAMLYQAKHDGRNQVRVHEQ
ncbi:GGDEF domain-containing protein [Halofilum ochraceum]|uniref:GGDEF domain-containing protein n=1 Tax=Halofilum ochraceum TaxID=1611323 RepID=UPI0008D9F40F|nr:GGDEF domain-containing protein [Halofilum ochraceum]